MPPPSKKKAPQPKPDIPRKRDAMAAPLSNIKQKSTYLIMYFDQMENEYPTPYKPILDAHEK